MENIELVKDEVSKVIEDTLEGISKFESKLKLKKTEITDINNIKKELRLIIGRLNDVQSVLDNVIGLYGALEEFLEQQQDNLDKSNFVLLRYRKQQLIALINENLPDGMGIRKIKDNDNEWKIVLLSYENTQSVDGRKKLKRIILYKNQEISIGEMLLTEIQEELLIRIKILDELIYQDFRIDNALRIFPIVNHIITRYNYKEEAKE